MGDWVGDGETEGLMVSVTVGVEVGKGEGEGELVLVESGTWLNFKVSAVAVASSGGMRLGEGMGVPVGTGVSSKAVTEARRSVRSPGAGPSSIIRSPIIASPITRTCPVGRVPP
jgi:hypothetical protein